MRLTRRWIWAFLIGMLAGGFMIEEPVTAADGRSAAARLLPEQEAAEAVRLVTPFDAEAARAKAEGIIGEAEDGYLEALVAVTSPEIDQLVRQVNELRAAHYKTLAERRGSRAGEVEALAGKVLRAADGR